MKSPSVVFLSVLVVLCSISGLSHPTRAQEDPCAGAIGAAYGLCTAYCVHLECENPEARASHTACQRIAANYARLAGAPLTCAPPTPGQPRLTCACASGFLSCSASGLEAGVPAFLNIDLTAYIYGFNGVADGVTDAQGRIQFPQFDVVDFLADRNLNLASVVMALTNQPGTTLAQTTVATCPR